MNYIGFDEIKGLCVCTKYTTKIHSKATTYVSELILTPFSPCYIKCKRLNVKNLWKYIFRAYRRVSFSYFPKGALDNKEVKG